MPSRIGPAKEAAAQAAQDPPGLQVVVVGSTAQLTWSPSPTPGVVDYAVFRRSPPTGVPFSPATDTPIAVVTGTSYDDQGLPTGSYEWQVFGRAV